VYYYFARWRDDGTDQTIHDLLRCQVRERAGRREDPSAVILDTQTVRASISAPAATTGLDPGKKNGGRKRDLAVDVLGLVIAVMVTAASVHDNAIGITLLDKVDQQPFGQQGVGGRGVQERSRSARGRLGHRGGDRPPRPAAQGIHAVAQTVGGQAGLRHADAAGSQGRARPSCCQSSRRSGSSSDGGGIGGVVDLVMVNSSGRLGR
jgi:transposase